MTTAPRLQAIFAPRSVAVIGASDKVGSVGHTVFHNLRLAGFPGPLWPINSQHSMVQAERAFAKIADLPERPDLAVICVPAAHVPQVVRECGEAGVRGCVIISAGFREAGEVGRELEAAVRTAAAAFPELRIIGPNCLGILVPNARLNASFAASMALPGRVAFVSQSGALCTAVLDWSLERKIGFSAFVSLGNALDLGMVEMIEHFANDPQTDALLLYIESLTDGPAFLAAAQECVKRKPIIAYKAGRFAESAKAAASHTGALAGTDAVFDAAFRRAGIERVFSMDELFDLAELLCLPGAKPRGERLAIVTNAGGPGVMATDRLLALRGTLATLSPATIAQLSTALPPPWSHGNPVDVLGDAPPERFAAAIDLVLADDTVDGVLVILTPQSMTDPTRTAQILAAKARSPKPILAAWMGGALVRGGQQILQQAGVPVYATPEQAVQAFQHLTRGSVRSTTPNKTATATANRDIDWLSEDESKQLLHDFGIPVTRPEAALTSDEAVQVANRIGYPVVMKIQSPDITHKTDVGGVRLGLANADDVRSAFTKMLATVREKQPLATIAGVTLQPQVLAARGVELILGAKRDPVFGPVLLAGMGGVTAELLQDRTLELAPLNESLARRMLASLRCWPLLTGYRGRPGVAVDAVVDILLRLSQLVTERRDIVELDINPLLTTGDGAIALDARVAVRRHATN